MTMDRLEQYRDNCREVKLLEKRIAELYADVRIATDSVKGSSTEFPYTQHTITIKGIDVRRQRLMRRRAAVLKQRRVKLEQECLEIEQWIDGLQDSKLRQIITLRFVKGRGWKGVAQEVYGSAHFEDAVRKRVTRFFEKIS